MKRTWKSFTVASGGTPQPIVGTLTATALLAATAPQSIQVVDSSMFRRGDFFWLDVGSNAERIMVTAIADGTHVSGIVTKAHATGVTVALDPSFTALYVQTISGNNAAGLVIFYPDQQFSSQRVAPNKTGLVKAIAVLMAVTAPTQPIDFSTANNFGANPDSLGYYWIDGTTGDGYLVSVDIT